MTAIFVLFGSLVLACITPPFAVPDEPSHLYRAYEISEGHWLSIRLDESHAGDFLPSSLTASVDRMMTAMATPNPRQLQGTMRAEWSRPLAPEQREGTVFDKSLYAPVPYLPQAFGIAIGRLFDLSPVLLMYLGRFCNCLVATCLLAAAVRLAPVSKWALAAAAVTPIIIFQVGSLSADAVTIALSFLFAALCWRGSLMRGRVLSGQLAAAICLSGWLLALSKQAYVPLLGLVCLIPTAAFSGNRSRRFAFTGLVLGGAAMLLCAWAIAVKPIYVPTAVRVNPAAQLQYMGEYPLAFLRALGEVLLTQGGYLARRMIGQQLGWEVPLLPDRVIYAIAASLLLVALVEQPANSWSKVSGRFRGLHLGVLIAAVVVLGAALYITWSPVGYHWLIGLQGRYFTPFDPLILVLFANQRWGKRLASSRWLPAWVVAHALYCCTQPILCLLDFYY